MWGSFFHFVSSHRPFFKRSRTRKGVQRLLLFVLKKWGIGVEWAPGRDPAGGARSVRTTSMGRRLQGQKSRSSGGQPLLGRRGSSQNGAGLPPLQPPRLTHGSVSLLAAKRCHPSVPEFRVRACSADLECSRAQPICRFPPLFLRSVLPFPESRRSSLPPRPPEPAPSLRGLSEIPPGPQLPEIFLRSVSQDLGG